MTIACVSIPHFALRVAVLDHPELDGTPLVLATPPGGRNLVADRTPEAAARGIRPGMSLREVTALCPEAVVVQPNPVREAAAFERIVTRLEGLSPLVEPAEPGCCYVDLRGLDRHYGTPERAAARLLQTVPPLLRPRVGLAPGKFAARVAAGQAAPGGWRIVPPGEVAAFLADLSVEWLPLPAEMLRRLERLGLRTMRDLAALPAHAVQARFGPAGRRAWELAQGLDDEPVRPRARGETVVVELALPAPATSRDALLLALRQLVTRAFARPALRGRGVRQARLRAQLEGGRSWEHVATLREPAGRERLIAALGHRLQAVELPAPLETLSLELTGLTAEAAHQTSLLGARPRRTRQLVEAIRQLKQRYGTSPIYRVVEVEPWSRIPERRRALISYDP
ncbi:MAG: DNA polymerase Y family protein [Sphaerobacter sp.]|nr:DNA polymerase Y family protein [Sphaerobacter sp.]